MNFFKRIDREKAYIVFNTYYAYFSLGLAVIMVGSILPALKEEYSLDYQVSGMLLSMNSAGYAIAGLASGFLPLLIGLKKSFIVLTLPLAAGIAIMLLTSSPVLLLAAMFMIGVTKGATSNFNNLIISDYSGGAAGPLNLLHATFALGCCLSPIAVLLFARADASGWRMAMTAAAIFSAIGILMMLPMRLGEIGAKDQKGHKQKASYGFLKEKYFWLSTLINFLYQGIEASMMGWLTSYAIESNLMTESSAQLVTSALWISLLVGRLGCSLLSGKFKPQVLLILLACLQLIFTTLLAVSATFAVMLTATIGLGLGMSGMYATSVSNAGDLFSRYPVSMGFFVLFSNIGAIIAPMLIGCIASVSSLHTGLITLIIVAAGLTAVTVYNFFSQKQSACQ